MSDNKFICKHDSLKRSCQICYLESEIESLKAITELAVKGLEKVSLIYGWNSDTASKDMYQIAYEALDGIKRLQNAQT